MRSSFLVSMEKLALVGQLGQMAGRMANSLTNLPGLSASRGGDQTLDQLDGPVDQSQNHMRRYAPDAGFASRAPGLGASGKALPPKWDTTSGQLMGPMRPPSPLDEPPPAKRLPKYGWPPRAPTGPLRPDPRQDRSDAELEEMLRQLQKQVR